MKEKWKEMAASYLELLPHTICAIAGWELGKWGIKLGVVFIRNFL
jgi:hypothetical protein